MKVIRGIHPDLLDHSVVTLGMFDGVHRGHQALLQSCRRHALLLECPAVVLTYEPHPSQILRPDYPIKLLTPLPEKLELLAGATMDMTVIPEFTPEFSCISPEQFIREVVLDALHPDVIVVGYRTTFGHARAGNADLLLELGRKLGFAVQVVEPVEVTGTPVSSTRIRQCLERGDVRDCAELLGYPYQVIGIVAHGDGRGRALGFPTANLEVPATKLVPAEGVYAVEAETLQGRFRGVMHIGNRPTFGRPPALEVHLLDFHGELYGQQLRVHFLKHLRGIIPFASQDELIARIHEDIALARMG